MQSIGRRLGLVAVCLGVVMASFAPAVLGNDIQQGSPVAIATATTCGASGEPATDPTTSTDTLSISTLVAPGAAFPRLVNISAINSAERRGAIVPATRGVDRTWAEEVIAYRDTLIHRIRVNGSATHLVKRLADGRSPPTTVFQRLVANGTLRVSYYGATACPPELALNASFDRGAIRILPDPRNDTLYVLFDTDRLLFQPLGGGEPTTDTYVTGHNRFSLTLRAKSPFATANHTVVNHYHVVDADVSFESRYRGLLTAASAENQTVRGRTQLAAGSELTLVLHPYTANTSPIVATTTVDRSRRFAVEVDLSDASSGGLYIVEVVTVTRRPVVEGGATVLAVGNATGAIVTATNQTSDGTILYGPSMTTTHGGFVVVRNASGETIGVSEYHQPGATVAQIDLTHPIAQNQTLTVTVYRDRNDNGAFDNADTPYFVNGSAVHDTVAVRLEEPRRTTRSTTSNHEPITRTTGSVTPTATGPRTTPITSTDPGAGRHSDTVMVVVIAVLLIGVLTTKRFY